MSTSTEEVEDTENHKMKLPFFKDQSQKTHKISTSLEPLRQLRCKATKETELQRVTGPPKGSTQVSHLWQSVRGRGGLPTEGQEEIS